MSERVYLTVAEVVAIHHHQIEEYGGEYGMLNQGALEAAVFRPQTGYYNDLSEESAALFESLVNNHAFDGRREIPLRPASRMDLWAHRSPASLVTLLHCLPEVAECSAKLRTPKRRTSVFGCHD